MSDVNRNLPVPDVNSGLVAPRNLHSRFLQEGLKRVVAPQQSEFDRIGLRTVWEVTVGEHLVLDSSFRTSDGMHVVYGYQPSDNTFHYLLLSRQSCRLRASGSVSLPEAKDEYEPDEYQYLREVFEYVGDWKRVEIVIGRDALVVVRLGHREIDVEVLIDLDAQQIVWKRNAEYEVLDDYNYELYDGWLVTLSDDATILRDRYTTNPDLSLTLSQASRRWTLYGMEGHYLFADFPERDFYHAYCFDMSSGAIQFDDSGEFLLPYPSGQWRFYGMSSVNHHLVFIANRREGQGYEVQGYELHRNGWAANPEHHYQLDGMNWWKYAYVLKDGIILWTENRAIKIPRASQEPDWEYDVSSGWELFDILVSDKYVLLGLWNPLHWLSREGAKRSFKVLRLPSMELIASDQWDSARSELPRIIQWIIGDSPMPALLRGESLVLWDPITDKERILLSEGVKSIVPLDGLRMREQVHSQGPRWIVADEVDNGYRLRLMELTGIE